MQNPLRDSSTLVTVDFESDPRYVGFSHEINVTAEVNDEWMGNQILSLLIYTFNLLSPTIFIFKIKLTLN